MAYTVNEIGTLTVVTGGGFAGDYATGWSASNYYHITDLNTAGSAQLHGFVIFYKGTQTDAGSSGELAIPLFGDKDNTGGITLGIDGGYLAISDGTTITRGTTLINDDDWHPIIFAIGDTTVKGYADGVLEVDVTPSNLSSVIINAIGNSAGATAYPTALDGIQIYDRYLFQSMVDDFQANIGGTSTPSSVGFITDLIIISQQQTHETVNTAVPIDTDFVPIVVQTNESMSIMEEQLGNTTLEDDLIFTKVYMNHELDNEEDKMNHRVQVVTPFAQTIVSREKWS